MRGPASSLACCLKRVGRARKRLRNLKKQSSWHPGLPTLILNWVGFRYTERFPRLVFFIHTGVLLTTATLGSMAGALILQTSGMIPPGFYWRELQSAFPISLVITLVVGLSITSYETLRHRLQDTTLELRTRQIEQERANKLLLEARLSSLESRIHPHFLFNTLNSIAALLHKDVEAADRMIARLGDFLRLTLNSSNAQIVDFEEELKFLKCYLDIEHIRFQDRLTVEMDIDPDALTAMVPNLILQPIVENALRHGVARQTDPGHITIRARREGERLIVRVDDNGPGLKVKSNGSGIGISNTRARLEQFYGSDFSFQIANSAERGVSVTLDVPAFVQIEGE